MTTQRAVAYAVALICVSCGSGESREGMPERASARHLKSGRDNGASFRDFQRRAVPQLAGRTSFETCVPTCGNVCGPDGCGGVCGTCPTGQVCNTPGVCVPACVPDCVGRQCGPDGCGGQCGDACCPAGTFCDAFGQCSAGCDTTCWDCCHVCPSAFNDCFGFFGVCYGCDTSTCALTCQPYCT
jgi:hypothetical protein